MSGKYHFHGGPLLATAEMPPLPCAQICRHFSLCWNRHLLKGTSHVKILTISLPVRLLRWEPSCPVRGELECAWSVLFPSIRPDASSPTVDFLSERLSPWPHPPISLH
jgi:hypothetical protein